MGTGSTPRGTRVKVPLHMVRALRGACAVALALALAPALGCGHRPPASTRDPIVLVGFDSADWVWAEPLMAQGNMPHFTQLVQRGVKAKLRSLQPPQKSPTIWTSIATGKRPVKHGVGGFTHLNEQLETSSARTAAAYWEILGKFGRTQAVIGWWVSYPPTPIDGVLISDYTTQYFPGPRSSVLGAVYPDSIAPMVDSLRVNPNAITLEQLARFVDIDIARAHGDSAWTQLEDLRWIYAADETYRRVARELYRRGHYDVFSLYFRGLDAVSHKYWQYFKPASVSFLMKPWEIQMMDSIVPAYYQYTDELLGDVLEYINPSSRVIVCSDHGFFGYRRTREGLSAGVGMHSDDGILVMAGPDIRRGAVLEKAEVKDVMPTLLALAGVPPAKDLDGNILGEALEPGSKGWLDRLLSHAVDSYEPLVPRRQGQGKIDPAVEEGILKQLRALGYIE